MLHIWTVKSTMNVFTLIFLARAVFSGANEVIFKCYMCKGGDQSIDKCDINKVPQLCSTEMKRCATFSYVNTTGYRTYGKSCTYEDYCTGKFCKIMESVGNRDCRIECCLGNLCNYQRGFALTTARVVT
ncbi:uncharacterized protein LOC116293437, partial [Actinia tenebrosa]|uniref:Uncharacterized protein LOC116293437 n=1 Tax=Actinia tenebrosa TaxID=6105 RepID=A0A6P8HK09_ACTTE